VKILKQFYKDVLKISVKERNSAQYSIDCSTRIWVLRFRITNLFFLGKKMPKIFLISYLKI